MNPSTDSTDSTGNTNAGGRNTDEIRPKSSPTFRQGHNPSDGAYLFPGIDCESPEIARREFFFNPNRKILVYEKLGEELAVLIEIKRVLRRREFFLS